MTDEPKKSSYGKRPLWQWILIYVVIGGIVYFGIYHFFLKGGYSSSYSNSAGSTYSTPTSAPSASSTPTQTTQPTTPVQQTAPQTNTGY